MPHLEVFYQQINIEKKLVLFNTKNIVSNGQLLDWCTVTKMVPVVGTFFSKWVPIRSLCFTVPFWKCKFSVHVLGKMKLLTLLQACLF